MHPRTTLYLLSFSRYRGFMNRHVTHMRVLIGSESTLSVEKIPVVLRPVI